MMMKLMIFSAAFSGEKWSMGKTEFNRSCSVAPPAAKPGAAGATVHHHGEIFVELPQVHLGSRAPLSGFHSPPMPQARVHDHV